jgi:hypothetical protein
MPWVESQSASFTARHDSADRQGARQVLDDLERFRASLDGALPPPQEDVAVVIHSRYALLALAHPSLLLAQLVAAPAARRYFGGWFSAREIHVLAPETLRRRAAAIPESREALRLAPLHEYAHVVIGALNPELPPPFTPRSFREYVRWAWLCEGAATWLSGQVAHLRPAIARRLREGAGPTLPPSARDATLLGGTVFALLEESDGADACVALASRLDPRGGGRAIEQAFARPIGSIARDWRDYLGELARASRL